MKNARYLCDEHFHLDHRLFTQAVLRVFFSWGEQPLNASGQISLWPSAQPGKQSIVTVNFPWSECLLLAGSCLPRCNMPASGWSMLRLAKPKDRYRHILVHFVPPIILWQWASSGARERLLP